MIDAHRDTTRFQEVETAKLPPLPKDPTPKPFRVLLVYPNYSMVNLLPTNIGILTACLRQNGFEVGLFDTTFYRTAEKTIDEIRVENLQVRKFRLEDFGVRFKEANYKEDFIKKVHEFKPDLIGVTCVEDTWPQGRELLEAVRDYPCPTIVGGVFPTLAPDVIIKHPDVDMICLGEGEYAIIDLATKLWKKEDHSTVQNLWVKKDGEVIKNCMRAPLEMDDVPFGDFDLFEPERFFRPMQGKIVRMAPIETDRGCPYTCRFCEAPSLVSLYKQSTGKYYFRRKSWKKVKEEIDLYIKKYDIAYVYFNAETFLAMSDEEFEEFVEVYKQIRLPYWCQTRIETITEKRLRGLEETNCNRISFGIEHGNEEFRRKVVGKSFKNSQVVDVFKMLQQSSIPITVNNIIGFPDDNRNLIFDTIELNRELGADSVNAYYFMPYRGTGMYHDAVNKGYYDPDQAQTRSLMTGPVMTLPSITKDELMGLVRTFSLYVKFPKEEWPEIRRAEQFDEEGNQKFAELSKRYYERFFDHDFKASRRACVSTRIYGSPKDDDPSVGKRETEIITN